MIRSILSSILELIVGVGYPPLILSTITGIVLIVLAGLFDNHTWRIFVLIINYNNNSSSSTDSPIELLVFVLTCIGIWWIPHWANVLPGRRRPKRGCIFVTGCDSGMGQATVISLAQSQSPLANNNNNNRYEQIFAGCFDSNAAIEHMKTVLTPDQMSSITVVPLDVTDDKSVASAVRIVQDWINKNNKNNSSSSSNGLTSIVQYHGVAYNGPASYMPLSMYQRQMDVNYIGTVRIIQSFLPLLKQRIDPKGYNGRIVVTGTGGGPCTPCPPLLTAYMSSKFALEAYTQSLRQELYLTDHAIDVCVINPGFVKPTMLMAEGIKLTNKMWTECERMLNGSTQAKDEYGAMMGHFLEYSALQPGTHVSKVVDATEDALLSCIPRTSYKVGVDSKVAPIVGMMPTGMREWIARNGIYGVLSPAGIVPGYKV